MGVVWPLFLSGIVASNLRGEVVFVNIVTCATGSPVDFTSLLDINQIWGFEEFIADMCTTKVFRNQHMSENYIFEKSKPALPSLLQILADEPCVRGLHHSWTQPSFQVVPGGALWKLYIQETQGYQIWIRDHHSWQRQWYGMGLVAPVKNPSQTGPSACVSFWNFYKCKWQKIKTHLQTEVFSEDHQESAILSAGPPGKSWLVATNFT